MTPQAVADRKDWWNSEPKDKVEKKDLEDISDCQWVESIMYSLTQRDKSALEGQLTITSGPRILPSSWQDYPKVQWIVIFSPFEFGETLWSGTAFWPNTYLGCQSMGGGRMDFTECCLKSNSEALSYTVSFNLFSSHFSLHYPYVHLRTHTHTHTHTHTQHILTHHHFGHHHKKK